MTSSIESLVRRHLHETADGSVREGQIDRVAGAVHVRRQVPTWYATLRSPVPPVDAPPPLRGPVVVGWLARNRSRTLPAAVAVVVVAVAWSVLGMLGGATPPPFTGASQPMPSPSAGATVGVPDCVTLPIGAISTGCIEVAQGWTFTLGDHSPRVGPTNDVQFDIQRGVASLSRPSTWTGPEQLVVATTPGRAGCLAALEAGQAGQAGSAVPAGAGIELETVDSTTVLCAVSGSGHVFELHLVDLTARGVATTTRVARFAWIDWGTSQ